MAGLYTNHLQTCVWLTRNENELTKQERVRVWQLIDGEPTEAERQELVQIRKKYDRAFQLQLQLAACQSVIDKIEARRNQVKSLEANQCEILIDDGKILSAFANLKAENEDLKIQIARLKDEVHWGRVELSSAWQTAERNKQCQLSK